MALKNNFSHRDHREEGIMESERSWNIGMKE
jgi:hypothetical protein